MHSSVEPLEARIAPAAILTFTDIDGDAVTVKTSKGTNDNLAAAAQRVASGMGEQLTVLDLRDPLWAGTTVAITAKKPDGSPSDVHVGYVNATGNDLGKVLIDGDLGAIDAGNKDKAPAAVAALTVKSFGLFGTTTGAPDLLSNLDGAVGKVTIGGEFKDASVAVVDSSGKKKANIAGISIAGSWLGGSTTGAGKITADGKIGDVFVGGDFKGGTASQTGYLYAIGKIGKVTIGGDLIGGTASSAGQIYSGALFNDTPNGIGAVKIMGTMKGGSGIDSGSITSVGPLASLFIGGNLEGGTAFGSGNIIYFDKPASSLKIMGDMIGGKVPKTTAPGYFFNTGEINAAGGFGSLYVGGDVLGGAVSSLGTKKFGSVTIEGSLKGNEADFSGTITNWGPVGKVLIKGDLVGGSGRESGTLAFGNRGEGDVASIIIEGSIIGGTEVITGNIGLYADAGTIKIGKDVQGSTGELSGAIVSFGKVVSISIGGSLIGGEGNYSGVINPPNSINSSIGKVEITGSMIGNTGLRSGSVWSLGTIAKMTVGGNVSSGDGIGSGGIRANTSIGSLTIEGNVTGNAADPVYITGGGIDFKTFARKAMAALGKIVIKGDVTHAKILAGWDAKADQSSSFAHRPAAVNGDASITSVLVEGSWAASDIVAGAVDGTGNGFGRNDTVISGDVAKAIAKIGSVNILGTAIGSAVGGEHYGIVAEQIGKLSVGGAKFVVTTGKDQGEIDIGNHNFAYLEV